MDDSTPIAAGSSAVYGSFPDDVSLRVFAPSLLKSRSLFMQYFLEHFGVGVAGLAQQWATALNRAFDEPPLAIDVGQRLDTTIRQFQRDSIDSPLERLRQRLPSISIEK